MPTSLHGFFRSRPRLAKVAVLGLLAACLTLTAVLGLQLHFPADSGRETLIEWAAFLVSLAVCTVVLVAGGRLLAQLRSDPNPADPARINQDS